MVPIAAPRRAVMFAMLALGGCSAFTDVSRPEVVRAEVSVPRPLVAALRVSLAQPAPLDVEYWTDGGPRLRVHSSIAAEHDVALLRLRAGRTYRYHIVGTDREGTVTTDAPPADLVASLGAVTGTRTTPLVMLHLYQPGGFMGYAVVDQAGEVVWYWRTPDFTFGAARRENGNFVLMDKVRGLLEVTPDGRLVHQLAQDVANREMHHDVIAGPGNSVLFIAFDDRTVDGRTVRGDAIWEWSPESGVAVKRWSVWDHFSFATAPAPRGGEWVHANALAIGPRGNILLSAHHWNQILSITPDWKTVEWRMGGLNATSPLPGAEQFSGQHTAREVSPGHVVMFDNGTDRGGYSRAVEYAMDAAGAHTVWEWRSPVPNFATAVGSARRMTDGGTLVTFGMSAGLAGSTGPTEVFEVGADGVTRWHLVVNTQVMFRAEPLEAIGGERVVP
jgi:hypothetical protein